MRHAGLRNKLTRKGSTNAKHISRLKKQAQPTMLPNTRDFPQPSWYRPNTTPRLYQVAHSSLPRRHRMNRLGVGIEGVVRVRATSAMKASALAEKRWRAAGNKGDYHTIDTREIFPPKR